MWTLLLINLNYHIYLYGQYFAFGLYLLTQ